MFLRIGFSISSLITWERPFLEIIPSLADISWRTIVAIIERTRVQRREKPKSSPAILHKVTVPGPIKAAAINGPGPILFIHFFIHNQFNNFIKLFIVF